MQAMAPIIKRELLSYFRSPVAYVFIIIFLLSTAGTTFYLGNFYQSNDASLEIFFFFHPWLYLILIPAVGMRLWAEDRRQGTIEILLTLPVSLVSAVLAKFLAAWLFIGVALALTFPMVITVYYLGSPDGGVILAGYLGSFLMAGAYLSISCLTSSLTKNQVVSFITSFLLCLVLVLLGWGVLTRTLVDIFPVWLADTISAFSFSTHFDGLRKGLIDVRDVVYFLSIIGFMLLANVLVLENKKSS
ncbi:MAG: ABC transporter permease subunit [Deltaproteobacteria bacterium]|nr:ABC transporter permease subunit [Deltaproteobacteria bacterium]